jgi:hypothetical protein
LKYFVFGPQRSGTTYLHKLLELNSLSQPIQRLRLFLGDDRGITYSKHAPPTAEHIGDYRAVCIVKDPFAWLVSAKKWWKSNEVKANTTNGMSAFLNSPVIIPPGYIGPNATEISARMLFDSPIDYWRWYYEKAFEGREKGLDVHFIRYEDLLVELEFALASLRMPMKPVIKDISNEVTASGLIAANKFNRTSQYINRSYLEQYDSRDYDLVLEKANSMIHAFRYDYI